MVSEVLKNLISDDQLDVIDYYDRQNNHSGRTVVLSEQDMEFRRTYNQNMVSEMNLGDI
jgi:hypothetical protein